MKREQENKLRRLATENVGALSSYLQRRMHPLSTSDLDDIVEETLIVIWRRIDDVPVDAERAWMIGVARNVLRNAKRSWYRRRAMEKTLSPSALSPSAEDIVLADEAVTIALASLSAVDREVLLLKVWDGCSNAEIAAIVMMPETSVAVRVSRAQAHFREAFQPLDPVVRFEERSGQK